MGRVLKVDTAAGRVSAAVDGPKDSAALVFLAHGAGAGFDNDFMVFMSQTLADRGLRVCRFNFAYMEAGRRSPDRSQVLEETYRAVVEHPGFEADKLILGGKSMGGRIASQIVASGVECAGLAFLGYPLHPPGRPDRLRDAHLREIKVPMLFVEGTRDPFCPLPTLERVRKKLTAPTSLAVIDDGDHSLKVRKSSGRTTKEAWSEAASALADWAAAL